MSRPILSALLVAWGALALGSSCLAEKETAAAHNAAGRRFIASGRWTKAIAEFQGALELEPGNVEAHTYLCRAYLAKGMVDEAITEGLRAVGGGFTPRGQAYLSMAYTAAGNLGAATTYAQAAIRLGPNLGIAHGAMALVHLSRGDYAQAADCARAGIEAKDRDPEVPAILARIYLAKGEAEEALRWAREAIRYQPISSEAHIELGRAYARQNNYESAAQAFAQALRLAPENAAARCEYADTLLSARDPDAALSQARQALDLEPELAEAHRAVGFALHTKGELSAAARELEAALSVGPSTLEAPGATYRRLAEVYRGLDREFEALSAEGEACAADAELDRAIDSFEAALKLRPGSSAARLRLARAHLAAHRLDDAEELFRQVLDGDTESESQGSEPAEVEALIGLGDVAYARRDIHEAVTCYKRALRVNPKEPSAWAGLGRAYDYQWRSMSRSIVRVGVRLTSPKEPFTGELLLPGGPVRIEGEQSWIRRSIGSGFVVNGRGDIITNAHVVEILRPGDWDYELVVGVRQRPGSSVRDYRPARVVAYDVDLDLAVLRPDRPVALPPLLIREGDPPAPGDWVFELGHPLGGGYGTVGGSVLGMPGGGVEYDAEFRVGMSGGPLVDESGVVVGVVCMGSPTKEEGLQRQLAASAETLRAFLDTHDIPYTTSD